MGTHGHEHPFRQIFAITARCVLHEAIGEGIISLLGLNREAEQQKEGGEDERAHGQGIKVAITTKGSFSSSQKQFSNEARKITFYLLILA
jgi:cyanate lyase